MKNETFKYYAFISYSHADKKIARKLQRRLESYSLPAKLRKTEPSLPKKLRPVFIDESDLVATGTLKTALQANLEKSNYLIVICSPDSAKSKYVNDEIEYFIKLGRLDRIIPFIVAGEPHSKDASLECFPEAILDLPREHELLGIDLTKFGTREAFLRVIATLLKLDLDNFISRVIRERRKKFFIAALILTAAAIIAIMLVPPPYDEIYAENVMTSSGMAYERAGKQYENLHKLTDTAINNPDDFDHQLMLYKSNIPFSFAVISTETSLTALNEMLTTGKVMPWSRIPMNQKECEQLLTLADSRRDEYKFFAEVLEFVMTDEFAKRYYSKQYPALLMDLLETDADINAELFQIVCTPHMLGKYADDSVDAQAFRTIFANISLQNKHLTGENLKQASENLARLNGARNECLSKLNSCGAFEAFRKTKEQDQ